MREAQEASSEEIQVLDEASRPDGEAATPRQVVVCRRKVGVSVTGGGFVAVFRKVPKRPALDGSEDGDGDGSSSQQPAAVDAATLGIFDVLGSSLG